MRYKRRHGTVIADIDEYTDLLIGVAAGRVGGCVCVSKQQTILGPAAGVKAQPSI
jgi:hypothetical protein